ncbi:TPA: tail fiber protein [Escherichia coli]|nr:tail fiber protein [Escherichia coli]
MHRIDTKTAQKDKFGAGKNGFTRGNPQTGTPATDLDDDYFDMLQEELCSVVEASGASLEKGRHDQLLTALRALLLSRNNPFGDIKSDGTVPTALENLGLGEGSALPVGVPVPWPSATPPTGWLKCNGSSFSLASYPKLAAVFPSGVLPDLRGEFIRGWDDGRGVDAGRSILTVQEDMIKSHEHHVWRRGDNSWIHQSYNTNEPGTAYVSVVNSSTVVPGGDVDSLYAASTGGSETRPRNIAFNYIVRAA